MAQESTISSPSPILIAARGRGHDLVKWFLEKDPTLIREKDEYNANLLHYIRDEALFKEIVQEAPELLQSVTSWGGEYPIHGCFVKGFSPTFIQWIIEQDPSQLYLCDANKQLPIHHAVMRSDNERLDLVKWILSKDSTFINAKTQEGRNLFHLAVGNGVIEKFLFEAAPELLLEKDNEGNLPIHYMSLTTDRNPLVLAIFEKFPQLLEEKDSRGRLLIHHACERGNNELVEWIVAHTPSFGQKSSPIYDHTKVSAPIFLAAEQRDYILVKWLLEKDPNWIGEGDDDNRNLLHIIDNEILFKEIAGKAPELLLKSSSAPFGEYPIHACFEKRFSPTFIRWVIEQDLSQLYLKNAGGELPIHRAIMSGKEGAFEVLVKWMLSKDPTLMSAKTGLGNNLFHYAAYGSCVPAMEFLFEHAPEQLLERNSEGKLPTYHMSWKTKNNPFLISFFKKLPQLLKERDRIGYLPIQRAAQEGNKELTEWIMVHSSSNGQEEDSVHPAPILIAASRGEYDIVRWFLEKDPQSIWEVWKEGDESATLLYFLGNEELFKEVVQKAPELLLKPANYGEYPVHLCLDRRLSMPFIQWVIEQDFSQLYLENKNGELAIHKAFGEKDKTIIKWILSKDPTLIHAKTKNGLTLFHFAAILGNFSAMEFLFEHVPEQLLEKDDRGSLPIHYLLTGDRNPFIISIFEKFPQLLEERDSKGYLPIHYACEEGNQELVEWIIANLSQEVK